MNLITAQIGAWYYVLSDDATPGMYKPVMLYATPALAAAYVAQFNPPVEPVDEPADEPGGDDTTAADVLE